jgi:replication factor C large subunit
VGAEGQPWSSRFRPRRAVEVSGNREAILELRRWLQSWEKGIPKERAVFLHGPPGVGKTASVQALAADMGFDLLEVNASDYRTRTRMEELVGRAATQSLTVFGRRRLILFDEMEGISGREDLGGIAAIADIIKNTRSPIVLIATSVGEENEEKFRPLRDKSLIIEYRPIPFLEVYGRLASIAKEMKIDASEEALEALAMRAEGDVRSAINDLESLAWGKGRVAVEDVESLGRRDRQEYTPDVIRAIFSSRNLREARRAVSQSYIGHEGLFDWIYENLPLILDDPGDLDEGLEALARADIYDHRARSSNYRLQKYMFNMMSGGVSFAKRRSEGLGLRRQILATTARLGYPQNAFTFHETADGLLVKPVRYLGDDWRRVNEALRGLGGSWVRGGNGWSIPYIRPPQLKWRYIRTYQSRQRLRSVSEKVAARCRVSRKEAISDVIPLMRMMFKGSREMGDEISGWLDLDDDEAVWLRG